MGVKEGKETRGSSLWKLEQKAVARVVVEGGGRGNRRDYSAVLQIWIKVSVQYKERGEG